MKGSGRFRTVDGMKTHRANASSIGGDGKLHAMAGLPLFAECSGEELVVAGRLFDTSYAAAGATFEGRETSSRWIYVLLEGVAVACAGERTEHLLRPGACWGGIGGRVGSDRTPSTMALTAVTLLSLDGRMFSALTRRLPSIAAELRRLAEFERQKEIAMKEFDAMTPTLLGAA